jgi:hypothetical protein
VSQIAFNEDDSLMTFTSADGTLQRFDMRTMKKSGESFIDRGVEVNSCVFMNDPKDKTKVISVGFDKDPEKGGFMRIYNKEEETELSLNFEKGVALTDLTIVTTGK